MASTRIAMGGRNANFIEQHAPINLKLAVPASTVAGDVVLIEEMPVYAQTDRDSDGYAICTIPCSFCETLLVYGRGNGTDSAVAIGDKLYFDAADGQINKDSSNGKLAGFALATVTSGSSGDILVGIGT